MGGWGEFVAAFAAFLLSHALPARPAMRGMLAATLGERGYLLVYSLVSLGMLAWLVVAAGRAPYVELWAPAPWQAWVPNLLMPAVCLLVAFGIAAPNPLSFGGHAAGFDPRHPGVAGITRHPLLLAILLWAAGHAVPNGNLAHLLLFGAFAGFAALGMRIIDRRKRRLLDEEAWARLAARSSGWPLAAWLQGRWRPQGPPGALRLLAGLVLWLLLLALHPGAIGVSPLPS
jgi:uncharacterized membrane protein